VLRLEVESTIYHMTFISRQWLLQSRGQATLPNRELIHILLSIKRVRLSSLIANAAESLRVGKGGLPRSAMVSDNSQMTNDKFSLCFNPATQITACCS
jgi:hypothetical protein